MRLRKKRSSGRAQPVRKFLRPGCLSEGVAGRAEDVDENTVFLTHNHVDLGGPEAVAHAEPAVLEALRMGESILLPKQGQGDANRREPMPSRASDADRWERRAAVEKAAVATRRPLAQTAKSGRWQQSD